MKALNIALKKNLPDIQLTKAELRTFMAILIVAGYNPLPSKAMHWNKGKDLRNEAIYESMRRDRFDNIMKSLHFASQSNLDQSDKYSKLRPIHFYCDNYFTSLPLCVELKKRGYNCTGTIRANRLGQECPLTDVKKFAKKERGYTEVATATLSGHKVFLNRWKDNSVVTVASTQFAANPEGSVKRWSKTEKKHIQVPIPHAINHYNRNMDGTDRTDQNVNSYRISIRGKKWWWCMFTWMLDVSVQNAWLLARKENPKLVQLQFRRDLAMSYLSAHSQPPKAAGRKPKVSSENQTMRLDKIGHFVRPTANNKQRRCGGKNCKSKVRTECLKCNVGLCVPCFVM